MKPNPNDHELDRMLALADPAIDPARLHLLRTRILVSAHSMAKYTLAETIRALFDMRPAVLVATGLLGLFLGAALPNMGLDNSANAAFLDYHPQAFLTGDYG